MAKPIIVFNLDEGLDDTSTSGAGPVPGINGTKLRTRNSTNQTRVAILDSPAPSLSLVNDDGSHLARISTGSGRKFFKIISTIGLRETALIKTGSINSGSNQVTGIADLTGFEVGEVFIVPGAGAVGIDLISTVQSISESVVFLEDNASTTVNGVACSIPKQFSIDTGIQLGSDTNWAIGGKRSDPIAANNSQLWLDIGPGYIIEIEVNGNIYESSSTLILTVSGDTTDGRIIIKGTGTIKPILKTTGGANPYFTNRGDLPHFKGLRFETVSSGIYVDSGTVKNTIIEDCEATSAGNVVHYSSAIKEGILFLRGCDFRNSTIAAKIEGKLHLIRVDACFFSHLSVGTMKGIIATKATTIQCEDTIFETIYDGIDLGDASGVGTPSSVINCDFVNTIHNSIRAGHIDRVKGFIGRNSRFDSQVYDFDFPAGSDAVVGMVDYNSHIGSAKLNNLSLGNNSVVREAPAKYRSRDALDYQYNDLADRGIGYPSLAASILTPISIDIGAAESGEPIGGGILGVLTEGFDRGEYYEFFAWIVNGDYAGTVQSIIVNKIDILSSGTINLDSGKQSLISALRDGKSISDLKDIEILL